MTFTAIKITEMPLRTSLTSLSFFSSSSPYSKPSFHSLRTPFSSSSSYPSNSSSIKRQNDATWLTHWAPPPNSAVDLSKKVNQSNGHHPNTTKAKTNTYNNNNKTKSQNAVERIVLRLRNLGLTPEEEEQQHQQLEEDTLLKAEFNIETQNEQLGLEEREGGGGLELSGEKLGDLLKREWIRPDMILLESDDDDNGGGGDDVALPWEREVEVVGEAEESSKGKGKRGLVVKAPTLAELTIEDEELRRLRREGMYLRDRISVAKAGITKDVLEKIHDKWRKQELVRLKFHEVLARDMKTAHEITEVVPLLFLSLLLVF